MCFLLHGGDEVGGGGRCEHVSSHGGGDTGGRNTQCCVEVRECKVYMSSVCKISVWGRGERNAHLPRECWLCLGRLKSGEGWMRSGEGEGEESV